MSDESLITAVSECPVLYDLTLKAYHDLTKRNQAWRDIAAMLGVTAEVSRKKWKYLRDKYLRERKAEKDRKKSGAGATSFKRWKYMAIMGFLERHVKERVTSSNMEQLQGDYSQASQEISPEILTLLAPSMSPQREVVAQSEEEISPPSPSLSQSAADTSPPSPPTTSTVALVTPLRPPPPRRRQLEQPLSVFQQSILSSIAKEKENVDEDEHFMLSLVPSLRRMSNQKKAQACMRMQQVLYDVEFGE
ncbi:unnamed protein product [Boreogadus saida]